MISMLAICFCEKCVSPRQMKTPDSSNYSFIMNFIVYVEARDGEMRQSGHWKRGREIGTSQTLLYPQKTSKSTGTIPHRKARS